MQSVSIMVVIVLLIGLYFVMIHRYYKYTHKITIIKQWLSYYQSHCDEEDRYTLNKQLKNIRHTPDAFETLFKTFKRVYETITQTPLDQVKDALYTRLNLFNVEDTVYDQTRDVVGKIDGLHDDNTYTVCDVTDQCHRAVEMDLIPFDERHTPDIRDSV